MCCLQVTVVDASSILTNLGSCDLLLDRKLTSTDTDSRSIATLLIDQIEFADLLVLNKVDLVTPVETSKIEVLLRKLNSGAKILPAKHCILPVDQLLNAKR